MSLELARESDLAEIRSLLRSSGLPVEDVDLGGAGAHWVWREGTRIAATVALDVLGEAAVLRSLATDPDFRGKGIGTALCDAAEAEAARRGVREIYLLTETAAAFFSARRGYRVVERSTVPGAVARQRQFAGGCGRAASAMTKSLVGVS